jgi:hypothetical protein
VRSEIVPLVESVAGFESTSHDSVSTACDLLAYSSAVQ